MKTNNKGFSLVELIVVIAIMAILAAIAIPTFAGFIGKANKAADEDFLNQTKYAIELANATDPEFAVESIEIEVDAKGNFTSVTYNENKNISKTAAGTEAEEVVDARAVIDWNYSFKNFKSETVTFELNDTTGKWEATAQ